jgi:hypothetical protein
VGVGQIKNIYHVSNILQFSTPTANSFDSKPATGCVGNTYTYGNHARPLRGGPG